MVISMPPPTAMYTRIPGAAGVRPRAPHIIQATQAPTRLPLAAMEGRKERADHRHLAAAEVGNPGRRVLVVRQAVAAAAARAAGRAGTPRENRLPAANERRNC